MQKTQHLYGFFPFEGRTDAKKLRDPFNNQSLTVKTGDAEYIEGRFGSEFNADGVTMLEAPFNSTLLDEFTISFLLRDLTKTANYDKIYDNSPGYQAGFALGYVTESTELQFFVRTSSSTYTVSIDVYKCLGKTIFLNYKANSHISIVSEEHESRKEIGIVMAESTYNDCILGDVETYYSPIATLDNICCYSKIISPSDRRRIAAGLHPLNG